LGWPNHEDFLKPWTADQVPVRARTLRSTRDLASDLSDSELVMHCEVSAGFYIVSSQFLTSIAALGREAGGIREHPGTQGGVQMMGWYGGGMGTFGILGMGLFWLILLGLIVWLVTRLLPTSGEQPSQTTGESAVEILDRRMANGDIDIDVWKAQRAALLAAQSEGK